MEKKADITNVGCSVKGEIREGYSIQFITEARVAKTE
jgi:hypothetical protein